MKTFKSFILGISAVVTSCNGIGWQKDQSISGYDDGRGVSHEMIVLGEQLEDPYSLSNVTKAIASLYPTKAGVVELEATDYYVRLLPRSSDDLRLLEKMGVQMMDHPLDYRIVEEGDYYHDPQIAEGNVTWQYAVVPPDFVAPEGVKCELLHKCYLAESETATKAGLEWIDWDAVEEEAFRLTGNEDMLADVTTKGKEKKEAKVPSGRITIIDEDYSDKPIGVSGVQVSCNVFVKFDRCYTDEEGYYTMRKSFKSKPRYRLVFTNSKGFTQGINAIFVKGSISTLGRHDPEGYSICVTEASEGKLFKRCAINNAAYDYYQSCASNGVKIKTPPANLTIWTFSLMETSASLMLHQGAILDIDLLKDLIGVYTPVVKLFMPDIILGTKNHEKYSSIYHLVQHELAHASHYMQVGNKYWDAYSLMILSSYLSSGGVTYGTGAEEDAGYCEVGETWAYYVENILYRQRYDDASRVFGDRYWFHPEILIYMDNRGLNRFKIFAALTSDVHSRETLRSRLLALYPECKSVINEAFNRYL